MDKTYKRTKKQNQTRHFKSRLRQRYKIRINKEEIEDYVGLIQANRQIQVVHLGKQSRRVSVKLLIIRGETVPVIYDKKQKTLVTALPVDWALGKNYLEERP